MLTGDLEAVGSAFGSPRSSAAFDRCPGAVAVGDCFRRRWNRSGL